MHARRYETVSTRIHSGAIVLSKLGVQQGCHALDIIAVTQNNGASGVTSGAQCYLKSEYGK